MTRIIILAVAYALIGKISLLLAIPPGYATLIWPPSGIAVAAVVAWGYRVWPGVFIGSFLANFTFTPETVSPIAWLQATPIPLGIAAGAALQAVASALFVHKFAGYPNRLETEKQAFLFLLWAGPLASSINSTIGTSVLFFAGKVSSTDYLTNLSTWWAGDTIGVFIFTPLFLVWILRPVATWRPRRATVTVPIVMTFALTVMATMADTRFERERLRLNFAHSAAALPPALERTLVHYIQALDSLAGLRAASASLDRQSFKTFFSRSLGSLGGIQAVSWNPVIRPDTRALFEEQMRAEGFLDFSVTERDASGGLVPVQNRSDYVVVSYIEPFESNAAAHGFDVGSNTARRQAFERARDTGLPVATSRITLLQETSKQFGVLVFMPVYKRDTIPGTIEERRENIDGYMVGVLRGGDIVSAALEATAAENLTFRLFDESASADEQFLYESRRAADGVRTLKESGIFGGATELTRTAHIDFAGRHWRFEINPTPEFIAQNRSNNSWIVLAAGTLLTGFIATFFLLLSGRSELLRAMVQHRTKDLIVSQGRLAQAQRIASLGNWEWEVGSNEFWWSDEVDNILGLGPGAGKRTLDTFVEFFHPDDRSSVRDGITRTVEDQGQLNIDRRLVLPNGVEKVVQLQAELVRDEDNMALRIAGVIHDITERVKLDRMKDEFVSNTSHELRTPLTSIKGALGLLSSEKTGRLSEKSKNLVELAAKNTERLTNLVNDILDLEKVRSSGLALNLQQHDLAGIVLETVHSSSTLQQHYGIKFTVNSEPGAIVWADKDRIIQVIANLLSNAAKFSPEGGEIEISVTHDADTATLSVADQGDGIPPDFQKSIFKPFFQADGSATRRHGGSGLGLHISKSLVEKHSGTLTFKTEAGRGTTFFMHLPLAHSAPKARTATGQKVVSPHVV